MDENTRRLAQFLLSEKDTRPHWETDQRAMLMPLVMSGYNNSVSYGVPSFFGGHAWSTMGDIVKGNAVHPDEIAHSANDAAGAAMLGSMPMGAPRGAIRSGAARTTPETGIRAYHGSPHNYNAERLVRHPDGRTEYLVGLPDVLPDVPSGATVLQDFPLGRVRMDKIGTGEGAQAFGHGWYAAENEGVAKSYRDALTGNTGKAHATTTYYDGLLDDSSDPAHAYLGRVLRSNGGDITRTKAAVLDHLAQAPDDKDFQRAAAMLNDPKANIRITDKNPGRMYEVNIKADPNDFLDWDKPLSQQSEKVRQAFSDAVVPNRGGEDDALMKELFGADAGHAALGLFDGSKGSQAYNTFAGGGGHEAAAKALREAGIPGIKYLDQGSRGAGKGSHNYVVFDDKLVEILRKYGLAGILAGGYAMTGQEPQE